MSRRKYLPLIFFSLGFIILGSVLLPLGYSWLSYYISRPPVLVNPLVDSGVPGPYIVNILGVATTNFYSPTTWFDSSPTAPSITTKVKYFTVSLPEIKLFDVPIEVNGTDLKKNAIHFPGTAIPGTIGNSVVFGHSALPQFYQVGNPLTIFNPLPKSKVGDQVVVNFDGVTYRYLVKDVREVDPSHVEVLRQVSDRSEITLITCVPLGTYWHRLVVRAELET